ncbi:MAG: ribonuclease P protein component [Bacteroidetes bacterium]|nr:ribonuclease P protein component [Bacteroidota bacterium]
MIRRKKLCHKATIDAIFKKKGESVFKSPILLAYYKTELITPFKCQVMISVGKRKFKKAVDRHRIKRQISESTGFIKNVFMRQLLTIANTQLAYYTCLINIFLVLLSINPFI